MFEHYLGDNLPYYLGFLAVVVLGIVVIYFSRNSGNYPGPQARRRVSRPRLPNDSRRVGRIAGPFPSRPTPRRRPVPAGSIR